MSKEELKPLLDNIVYNRFDTRVTETFLNAMVAAYNRAIEDAKKIENIGVLGQMELEQLKIKD